MPTKKRKPPFRAAIHVRKGAFHKWLGKKPDSPITAADIAKGRASDDPHVVKMATFAASAKKWH
jgi:hypothetical protein